ncbi:MAG: hypothetical protein WKG07_08475 [Hymenobacter sp.]
MNDQLFMNTHLTYSQYQFDIGQTRTSGATTTRTASRTPARTALALPALASATSASKPTSTTCPHPTHYLRFGGQIYPALVSAGRALAERSRPDNSGSLASQLEPARARWPPKAPVYVEDDYRLTDPPPR